MRRPVDRPAPRALGIPGLLGLFVVYLGILQGVALVSTRNLDDAEYAGFYDTRHVWLTATLAVGCSVLLLLVVVSRLGWWRLVLRDDRPMQRWGWWIPAIIIATVAVGTNYSGLAGKDNGYIVTLAATVLLVGFGEEVMFRGIAVQVFRARDYSESKVLIASSVLFGLAHASNIVLAGPQALVQVAVTMVAGVFFYLTRRVSGGLLLPVVLHALWDFGVMSANTVKDDTYAGAVVFFAADVAMAVLVWRRRRRIEPTTTQRADAHVAP